MIDKINKLTVGCYSKNPEKDKYNWTEYTDCEGGDEVSTCPKCDVDYFGFKYRETCAACNRDK